MDKFLIALVSFVVGIFFQNYRAARSEESALINEHIKDIEKFSEAAQTYWLKKARDSEEDAFLAAKVRVSHAGTTLLYDKIARICASRSPSYQSGMKELYQIATGDTFESAKRTADPERAMAVADMAVNLVHTLRISRSDLLSLRHAFRVAGWWLENLWRNHGPKP